MADKVANHYAGGSDVVGAITESLRKAGKDAEKLTTADLGTVDEFHIRGRQATLELARSPDLNVDPDVLDIGSGLGRPARTLAQAFCDAAAAPGDWVGAGDHAAFRQGDATSLPFANGEFDAAMTVHLSMNIARKDHVYAEAKRVLKPGDRLAVQAYPDSGG